MTYLVLLAFFEHCQHCQHSHADSEVASFVGGVLGLPNYATSGWLPAVKRIGCAQTGLRRTARDQAQWPTAVDKPI
jgi:hypothetical protein